ncbi:hypothetical protein D3C73_1391200 [compost metagenome]
MVSKVVFLQSPLQIIVAVRVLLQSEINLVAVIITGREKEVMPSDRIMGQLHQRLPVVAVQAVAGFEPDAAE